MKNSMMTFALLAAAAELYYPAHIATVPARNTPVQYYNSGTAYITPKGKEVKADNFTKDEILEQISCLTKKGWDATITETPDGGLSWSLVNHTIGHAAVGLWHPSHLYDFAILETILS